MRDKAIYIFGLAIMAMMFTLGLSIGYSQASPQQGNGLVVPPSMVIETKDRKQPPPLLGSHWFCIYRAPEDDENGNPKPPAMRVWPEPFDSAASCTQAMRMIPWKEKWGPFKIVGK